MIHVLRHAGARAHTGFPLVPATNEPFPYASVEENALRTATGGPGPEPLAGRRTFQLGGEADGEHAVVDASGLRPLQQTLPSRHRGAYPLVRAAGPTRRNSTAPGVNRRPAARNLSQVGEWGWVETRFPAAGVGCRAEGAFLRDQGAPRGSPIRGNFHGNFRPSGPSTRGRA